MRSSVAASVAGEAWPPCCVWLFIALANKVSKQKAQLQNAKKQFEVKLKSANQLYREVEEMRELLAYQIGYLDQEALGDIPKLTISL